MILENGINCLYPIYIGQIIAIMFKLRPLPIKLILKYCCCLHPYYKQTKIFLCNPFSKSLLKVSYIYVSPFLIGPRFALFESCSSLNQKAGAEPIAFYKTYLFKRYIN